MKNNRIVVSTMEEENKTEEDKEDKEEAATVPNISTTKYPTEVNHG